MDIADMARPFNGGNAMLETQTFSDNEVFHSPSPKYPELLFLRRVGNGVGGELEEIRFEDCGREYSMNRAALFNLTGDDPSKIATISQKKPLCIIQSFQTRIVVKSGHMSFNAWPSVNGNPLATDKKTVFQDTELGVGDKFSFRHMDLSEYIVVSPKDTGLDTPGTSAQSDLSQTKRKRPSESGPSAEKPSTKQKTTHKFAAIPKQCAQANCLSIHYTAYSDCPNCRDIIARKASGQFFPNPVPLRPAVLEASLPPPPALAAETPKVIPERKGKTHTEPSDSNEVTQKAVSRKLKEVSHSDERPHILAPSSAMAALPPRTRTTITKEKEAAALVAFSDSSDDDSLSEDDSLISSDDDVTFLPTSSKTESPHSQASDNAKEIVDSCNQILANVRRVLSNEDLLPSARGAAWSKELQDMQAASLPKTVIGVLGGTGVGKSSMLNALLDEASILPTSGSRGCTAAVVELRYNEQLKAVGAEDSRNAAPVYTASVEFMKKEDWFAELKNLVNECSTREGTLYKKKPDPTRDENSHAAWGKIEQVYGRGVLDMYFGANEDHVLEALQTNSRVSKLLNVTPFEEDDTQTEREFNTHEIRVGKVNRTNYSVLSPTHEQRKKWAKEFRAAINEYVYRTGNGHEPQMWPLIRKVVCTGPWPVLSTGACLVDLPGVKDSNAARANVAATYLQNCSCIWVVAPIKRAVDDGCAKELMGEQFKRRMLMDGQYGNVSFICTQTDDVEPTEIYRDHADVADRVPGRLEKIRGLVNDLDKLQHFDYNLDKGKYERTKACKEIANQLKYAKKRIKAARHRMRNDAARILQKAFRLVTKRPPLYVYRKIPLSGSTGQRASLTKEEKERERLDAEWNVRNSELKTFIKQTFKPESRKNTRQRKRLQKQLKPIAATVRNEYSTSQLQDDFRAGLEEMCRPPDIEEIDEEEDNQQNLGTPCPLSDDFKMDVFCISANDYLKVRGIKNMSDGPPNCFQAAPDTNIPSLRSFVHHTTSRRRKETADTLLEAASSLLDQIKLYISDSGTVSDSTGNTKECFKLSMKKMEDGMKGIVQHMVKDIETCVDIQLKPSVITGAKLGERKALKTVESWGSKERRNARDGQASGNGLYWSTYFAAVRRDGEYVSGSAGIVNFNQELCDPVEQSFMVGWEKTMNTTLKRALSKCEASLIACMKTENAKLVQPMTEAGVASARLTRIFQAAQNSAVTAIKSVMKSAQTYSTNQQREINRNLLPVIQEKMKPGYEAACATEHGTGRFRRIKGAVSGHAEIVLDTIFRESTATLLRQVSDLIEELAAKSKLSYTEASLKMGSVYSVTWESAGVVLDPATKAKRSAARIAAKPKLVEFRKDLDIIMQGAGVARDEMGGEEFVVEEVQDLAEVLQSEFDAAKANNTVVDLTTDEADFEFASGMVKREPESAVASESQADAPGSHMWV